MTALASLPRICLVSLLVGLSTLGLLLGAFALQYWAGLSPCHLCLLQRGPLVAGCILALTGFASGLFEAKAARIALAAAGLCLLMSAGIGVYHSGVERHWWAGPDTCTGSFRMPKSAADFAAGLAGARLVRCDEIPWAFARLSLANYNVLFSGTLALLAGYAVARTGRK